MVVIDQQHCTGCGGCASVCPDLAIIIEEHGTVTQKCRDCGLCIVFCPISAIAPMKIARKEQAP